MALRRRRADLENQIREIIVDSPAISEEGLAEQLGLSRGTVSSCLRKLIADRRIRPKGYYVDPPAKPRRRITMYIFINYEVAAEGRKKLIEALRANAGRFPYVRVTAPFDYIAFVGDDVSASDSDEYIMELVEAGARTQTSVRLGEAPPGSPELPLLDAVPSDDGPKSPGRP